MALNLSQKQNVVAEVAEVAAKAHSLIAVIWLTVTPAYSTAIRECAFAATSATSATTFCFWDRLRAIVTPLMNSAHGSSHVRSWAMPVLGIGDAGIPVVAIQICSRTNLA